MTSDKTFSVHAEQGLITIEGTITHSVSSRLTDAYNRAGSAGAITLDFKGLEHITISSINELIKLMLRARLQGRQLVAIGLSPHHRDVFRVTRIDESLVPQEETSGHTLESQSVRETSFWARPIERIRLTEIPEGATNLNVDGLEVVGPMQGFGQLWEKTFRVRLAGSHASPKDAIKALKAHFPSFQPPQNRFYPTRAGIAPGEVVLINASTPAGLICTGVWVLYSDEDTFTFMTPQGHPESGWVSFSAFEEDGCTIAQVVGFARANDPLYEIGFRIMGSREHERIWTHVLESLAGHFGVPGWVRMYKACVDPDFQWDRTGNIWYNAQIRTMISSLRKGFSREIRG
jgi:anti-anti-sigma regulatory factor